MPSYKDTFVEHDVSLNDNFRSRRKNEYQGYLGGGVTAPW